MSRSPPSLLTASVLLSTSDRGGEAFIELGGGGARIVTSGSRRHITSCRQALTVGASGEIKEDSCFIDSSAMTLLGCNNVIINNSTAQGY